MENKGLEDLSLTDFHERTSKGLVQQTENWTQKEGVKYKQNGESFPQTVARGYYNICLYFKIASLSFIFS